MNNTVFLKICPNCHYNLIPNFNFKNLYACPSCNKKFVSETISASDIDKCKSCLDKHTGTNNVYYNSGCPALMSDGRFITYYNSANELTEELRKLNNIKSSNKFRNFMQNNANQFINAERNYLIRENTCSPAIACSEGWYNLWTKNKGNWGNIDQIPPTNS